jgi:ABC-type sugar transport system substrate-binding protein
MEDSVKSIIVPKALLAVTATAALALSACGSSDDGGADASGSGSDVTVGSILYSPDGYQAAHGKAMEAYGEEIGVNVKTCNSNADVATQLQCVTDMVAAQVDAVVIQPIEPDAATTMVQQLQDAGIEVVTWAIGPVPGVEAPFVPLAEYDQAKEAGATAAQWVIDNFDESPKIVDLGVPNNTNCENRETGFIDGAKSVDPATEVVAQPNGKGLRLESATAMSDVIGSGAEFNIVTGCNGESTLGGLQALREAGRGKAVDKKPVSEYLFSVDGTKDEITELIDPTSPLMETLALTPYDNVRVLLDTAIKLHEGEVDNSYETELTDVSLPTDCAAVNEILKKQYDDTVDCS